MSPSLRIPSLGTVNFSSSRQRVGTTRHSNPLDALFLLYHNAQRDDWYYKIENTNFSFSSSFSQRNSGERHSSLTSSTHHAIHLDTISFFGGLKFSLCLPFRQTRRRAITKTKDRNEWLQVRPPSISIALVIPSTPDCFRSPKCEIFLFQLH